MVNLENLPAAASERLQQILPRAIWGLLGGAIATASKFLGQDFHWYRVFKATKDAEAIDGMFWTYVLLLALLCFIGAVVAGAFQGERHPMKLLWLGVAAPALVTTWLGGQSSGDYATNKTGPKTWIPSLVSNAFAADGPTVSRSDGFWRGAGIVFGVGKDQSKYRVVVGSYPSRAEATAMLERVHKTIPGLNVFTAEPKPGNSFYGVVVGPELPFGDAQKLRDELSDKLNIKDTYLSRYPG